MVLSHSGHLEGNGTSLVMRQLISHAPTSAGMSKPGSLKSLTSTLHRLPETSIARSKVRWQFEHSIVRLDIRWSRCQYGHRTSRRLAGALELFRDGLFVKRQAFQDAVILRPTRSCPVRACIRPLAARRGEPHAFTSTWRYKTVSASEFRISWRPGKKLRLHPPPR